MYDLSPVSSGSRLELDLLLRQCNLAIEHHGLYWHSETNGKNSMYHYRKYMAAKRNNIQLLQFFEDEWLYKQDIVKSIILVKLGRITDRIYARKTEVREIPASVGRTFLNLHHLQGGKKITSVDLGLFYDKELVSVMTFNRVKDVVDLSRFSSKGVVVGGFSKMLSYFENKYAGSYQSLISYSDNRISHGEVYLSNGFTKVGDVHPTYFWCKGKERWHRSNFQHRLLEARLETYDPELTEDENCKNNGYHKVWDAGKVKWIRVI